MWQLTKDTGVLDLNSSYSYLLWCRDFAQTSIVAEIDGQLAGFITGYLRPDEPHTLMVWQVGVSEIARGQRIASRMLDQLIAQTGASTMETTITDDNAASKRLFGSFADRHGAQHTTTPLFTPDLYPDGHDTEYLHRIGPLPSA